MRLLSHWNLRDELKADYARREDGPRQAARDREGDGAHRRRRRSPPPSSTTRGVDWNPFTNEVRPAAVKDSDGRAGAAEAPLRGPEPDTRYAMLLARLPAPSRQADPYSPTAPTLIARRFDEDREIPEARVRKMLEDVLSSPLVPRVAELIEKRLGRKLEPFDIWYSGFRPRAPYSEAQLDEIVRKRYPTAEAYKKDIPNLLVQLGFTKEKAEFARRRTSSWIPARGSGHALGAAAPRRQGAPAHARREGRDELQGLQHRRPRDGAQRRADVLARTRSTHTLLQGVPNNAFTEALAFVFQARDLELLGLAEAGREGRALEDARTTSGARTRSRGVALVDMGVWHWMYDAPRRHAGAAEGRRRSRSRATSGTATTRPSSARRT